MHARDSAGCDRPDPLVEVAVEPAAETDEARLAAALDSLAREDPLLTVGRDPESGQTLLSGMSESHLSGKVDLLRDLAGLDLHFGAPQVAYRETITRRVEVDHTYKKQTGGSGQFAKVTIAFEPANAGDGYGFDARPAGAWAPQRFLDGVAKGLEFARGQGLLAGFPVIDFTATLLSCAYHDLDSSEQAFEVAARAAFRELRDKGRPVLLEPVMKVEVSTPAEHLGVVIGDLNSRRGRFQGVEQRGDAEVVLAVVPLAGMFGYAGELSALTQGRAQFAMCYDRYQPIPQHAPDDDPRFPPAIGMRA